MTRQTRFPSARAWVEIDLGALRRNATVLAERAGVPLLPMVKADAYGLGVIEVVRALEPLQPWGYGVATVEEGRQLRESGIGRPIVVFTPLGDEDLPGAATSALIPVLSRGSAITLWGATRMPWHLGIDTGMSRAGVRWDDVGRLVPLLRTVIPAGACTHFHSAELNDGTMEEQERRFITAVEALPSRPPMLHLENGAAIARRRGSRWSVVRPGIFLYGVGSGAGADVQPEPVVSVRARIVELRTLRAGEPVSYDATWHAEGARTIATVPIGYADGYRRALSNRGTALVNGRPARVAGIVTMDMTMIDVTNVPCDVGDVVTLIGRDGGASISVEDVAAAAEMSPYELLTGLRQRMTRSYPDSGPR